MTGITLDNVVVRFTLDEVVAGITVDEVVAGINHSGRGGGSGNCGEQNI